MMLGVVIYYQLKYQDNIFKVAAPDDRLQEGTYGGASIGAQD